MNSSKKSSLPALCAGVFLISLAYVLVVTLWGDFFVDIYFPWPRYLCSALAWPLCYLSGTLLPILLLKEQIVLSGSLRTALGVAGAAALLFFLLAYWVPTMGSSTFFFSVYATLLADTPALLFPPCVLLCLAFAGTAGRKAPPNSRRAPQQTATQAFREAAPPSRFRTAPPAPPCNAQNLRRSSPADAAPALCKQTGGGFSFCRRRRRFPPLRPRLLPYHMMRCAARRPSCTFCPAGMAPAGALRVPATGLFQKRVFPFTRRRPTQPPPRGAPHQRKTPFDNRSAGSCQTRRARCSAHCRAPEAARHPRAPSSAPCS